MSMDNHHKGGCDGESLVMVMVSSYYTYFMEKQLKSHNHNHNHLVCNQPLRWQLDEELNVQGLFLLVYLYIVTH